MFCYSVIFNFTGEKNLVEKKLRFVMLENIISIKWSLSEIWNIQIRILCQFLSGKKLLMKNISDKGTLTISFIDTLIL